MNPALLHSSVSLLRRVWVWLNSVTPPPPPTPPPFKSDLRWQDPPPSYLLKDKNMSTITGKDDHSDPEEPDQTGWTVTKLTQPQHGVGFGKWQGTEYDIYILMWPFTIIENRVWQDGHISKYYNILNGASYALISIYLWYISVCWYWAWALWQCRCQVNTQPIPKY